MVEMTIRRFNTDFSQGFPRYWLGGDPFRTLLWNSLSMSLPAGEQFIVDTAREFADIYENDPELCVDVETLIAQEALHTQIHRRYNKQLDKQGFQNLLDLRIRKRVFTSASLHRLKRLSLVMANEHFAAAVSDVAFHRDAVFSGAHGEMKDFWFWHMAEEIEHKSVAFDLFRAAGGSYALRLWGFFVEGFYLLQDSVIQVRHDLKQDRVLHSWRTWRSMAAYLCGRNGLIWHVVPLWLSYLSPWFHPERRKNRAFVSRWATENTGLYAIVPRRGSL